jgi:hypothetical protein
MGLESTPEWESAANAIAGPYFADFIEICAWMRVKEVAGFEDEEPIASIVDAADQTYGVFEFQTKRLCVLAITSRTGPSKLTHIFVRRGPQEIRGARSRAVAAARAIGVTPFVIV